MEKLKASGNKTVEVPAPASLDVMVDGIVPTGEAVFHLFFSSLDSLVKRVVLSDDALSGT